MENKILCGEIEEAVYPLIACCNHSSNNNYTSISISKKAEPMKNVQAVFLGMGIGFSDMKKMKIYIDSNNENINGRLIRVPYK